MIFACLPVGGGAFAAEGDHTVTFDLNGGVGTTPATITVASGAAIGVALPDVGDISRVGYEFKGWYAISSGSYMGIMASESHPIATSKTAITADTTLYAAWQAEVAFVDITTAGGVTLGITAASKLLDEDGAPIDDISEYLDGSYDSTLVVFKDLNGNGELDDYEDWTLPVSERVDDLAAKLAADTKGIEKMAGLMLYSSHQMVNDPYIGTAQKQFLTADHLRHVLVMQISDPVDAARWTNNVQAYLEGQAGDYGIPANNSSDPRHGADSVGTAEYSLDAAGISAWPSSLGIAATFDPKVMLNFGQIASTEYRLMGIATALSPQIDIATDPRWSRFNGTFGEDPKLAADMTASYVRGFQSSYSIKDDGSFDAEATNGWGPYSVNAMIKHWPGGGAGEGGQDAHYAYGKYAVYPGGNFNAHLIPFVDGAFGDVGPTEKATAVMPYYTISYLQVPGSEPNSSNATKAALNMANAYSKYMITDLLRGAYKFNGVVCTDWNVIGPSESAGESMFGPTPGMIWGVDDHHPGIDGFTRTDRQGRADLLLRAGVNQFGGLNTIEPIVDAYNADKTEIEPFILASTKALLTNIFNPGLFENPYVNIDDAEDLLGSDAFVQAGYQAQLDSTVLLKNKGNVLPLADGVKVYVPGAASGRTNPKTMSDDALALIKTYFGEDNVITDPAKAGDADVALVFGSSLLFGGGSYNSDGSIAFKPAAIDYKAYTAVDSRAVSVAGAPIRDSQGNVTGRTNNSYKGKTANPFDAIPGFFGTSPSTLPNFLEDIKLAEDSKKPLIFSLKVTNPMVLEDIEPLADAVLLDFENQMAAVLDIIVGETKNGAAADQTVPASPKGLLPMQMPKDMATVEEQYEDVPRDMTPYTDSEGNVWDFGFGLTYGASGTTKTTETLAMPTKYNSAPLTTPVNADGASAIADRIKVSFDYNADGKADFIKIVKKGTAVSDIVDPKPTRMGYNLLGWKNGDNVYDFSTLVNANLTLTPNWKAVGTYNPGTSNTTTNNTPQPPATTTQPAVDAPTSTGAGVDVPTGPLATYSDQASIADWARPFVEKLVTAGIMSGRTNGTIDPNGDVTRAEFTKMISLAMGLAAGSDVKTFSDVSVGDWHKEFVDIASSNNIVTGVSSDSFAPNLTITRQDICTIVYRALTTRGVTLPAADGGVFPDSALIADYAKDAVSMLKQLGIVSGRESGAFDPLAYATRQETAKIICGVQDFVAGQSAPAAVADEAAASEGSAEATETAEGEAAADSEAAGNAASESPSATK
jgi:beta-glucosidase